MMTSKYPKDMAVLLATAATTLLTCLILAFIDLTTGFSLYGFNLWFIVPIGALFAGFAAASGCYAAARLLNHQPTRVVLAGVLALSALTFFVVHYLDYYFTTIEGQRVRDFVSFPAFLNISLTNMALCVHGCAGGGLDLGVVGYAVAGLQILGFFVGGAAVYLYLKSEKYCAACARYYAHKKTEKRYFWDLRSAAQAHGAVLELLREGQFHQALSRHAASGEATRGRDAAVASELQLRYCTNCLRHHVHVALQQRHKNDWKTVPNSEADVETAPHFQTSFVTP